MTMKVVGLFVTIVVSFSHSAYSVGIVDDVRAVIDFGYQMVCNFKECCTDNYIPGDFTLLNELLAKNLYGQHLAYTTVLYALRSHVNAKEPKKALAMSFHGLPGTGKNYIADFIVKALYTQGKDSNYVHYYNGRLRFRSEGLVKRYQGELQKNITEHLKACPRSIFIFDEVEKIPKGTLDILVPFLDYHPKIPGVDPTRAIFIFLSNTGGIQIGNYLFEMWKDGKTRKAADLQELERLLAVTAFNENGGFYKSDTIESSLIDHYVPFLPLEEGHVLRCIVDSFHRRNITPDEQQIAEAKTHITFEPHPYNVYSIGGCKRIDQKVGQIVHGDAYSSED